VTSQRIFAIELASHLASTGSTKTLGPNGRNTSSISGTTSTSAVPDPFWGGDLPTEYVWSAGTTHQFVHVENAVIRNDRDLAACGEPTDDAILRLLVQYRAERITGAPEEPGLDGVHRSVKSKNVVHRLGCSALCPVRGTNGSVGRVEVWRWFASPVLVRHNEVDSPLAQLRSL